LHHADSARSHIEKPFKKAPSVVAPLCHAKALSAAARLASRILKWLLALLVVSVVFGR
jgi:hypothetical protein